MTKPDTRTKSDTFGPIEVATDVYWGAQAQRSLGNFKIGTERQPPAIIPRRFSQPCASPAPLHGV